jgi:hypothetical protein
MFAKRSQSHRWKSDGGGIVAISFSKVRIGLKNSNELDLLTQIGGVPLKVAL